MKNWAFYSRPDPVAVLLSTWHSNDIVAETFVTIDVANPVIVGLMGLWVARNNQHYFQLTTSTLTHIEEFEYASLVINHAGRGLQKRAHWFMMRY